MSTSATPISISPIDARAATLVRQFDAKGDLELYFIRQITGHQLTIESLQRNIDDLLASADVDYRKLDSLIRSQARTQRMELAALKELKDLQSRRNLLERFPDQTRDCPPLADHFCHVGERPIINSISPLHRGRLYPPTDNRPMRYKTPEEGNVNQLVVDEKAMASAWR